jgi:hypothetical protein
MKKIIFTTVALLTAEILFSQTKKDLGISFGVGMFNSPYYQNAKKRNFYNFDFDYYIGNRHILSASFLKGNHLFYDNVHSNNAVPLTTPGYEDNTNSDAEYFTFSILYKYKLISYKKASVQVGTGAGIMTQVILFPYTAGNIVDFRQSSWNDLVFPLRLEADYELFRRFKLGIMGGLYILPDYPILGNHAGLRFTYVLK